MNSIGILAGDGSEVKGSILPFGQKWRLDFWRVGLNQRYDSSRAGSDAGDDFISSEAVIGSVKRWRGMIGAG
ncbi:hypothetical protein DSO57_1015998 [Entomophthora muscae]|uniref:Uncharacterized protein n=1 Tax=Entomophthora muscae TaxID=34485 RepID=A0ACC2SU37_9FUNG|nr:hypothetical protein DSO57_1015998 [Entomophthora muscae]